MSDSDDRSPEEEFAVLINQVMARGIQTGADPDTMARICLNTARELFEHYDAGQEHDEYLAYVTDAQFEKAEIEAWLDEVEGRPWSGDE